MCSGSYNAAWSDRALPLYIGALLLVTLFLVVLLGDFSVWEIETFIPRHTLMLPGKTPVPFPLTDIGILMLSVIVLAIKTCL